MRSYPQAAAPSPLVAGRHWLRYGITLAVLALLRPSAHAQQAPVPDAVQQRIDHLEKVLSEVEAELQALKEQTQLVPTHTDQQPPVPQPSHNNGAPDSKPGSTSASTAGVNPPSVENGTLGENVARAPQAGRRFFERKPGSDLTFFIGQGEITAYGNLDVSIDVMTKGIRGLLDGNGLPPVGDMGWLPDISTNLSYIGIRGLQATGVHGLNFVYQLETQLDISATSGINESNSSESNAVKGALTSRNSFIGLGSPRWGAVVFGKTDAPYKQSTARLNPFFAMIGDYAVIMGNTGGDNRVEFGTRLDHSIWYSSSKLGGFEVNTLFSPGQNRASDSSDLAAGESDCTGNDIPGSGGSLPFACNDGGFSDAVSASFSYTRPTTYLVAAYERHMKVNRQSDLTGQYANVPPDYFAGSVADEDAAKLGAQFLLPTKTNVSAIFESMHRYVPYFLEFQNERQRLGSWLAVTQTMSKNDSISAGWARAYRTPGDPGQHNTSLVQPPLAAPGDATGGRGMDNSAHMVTVAYRHKLGAGLVAYAAWAGTFNAPYGHYDLGAGGRGVTTDCHDASGATGGESSDPHCWAGGQLKAVSLGLDKRF